MARQGHEVKITTPLHFKDAKYRQVFGALYNTPYMNKCPDLIIDNKFYEYESYKRPFNKKKISNMLSHGARQSPNLIINNIDGASDNFISKLISARLSDSKFTWHINQVWVYDGNNVRRIW